MLVSAGMARASLYLPAGQGSLGGGSKVPRSSCGDPGVSVLASLCSFLPAVPVGGDTSNSLAQCCGASCVSAAAPVIQVIKGSVSLSGCW